MHLATVTNCLFPSHPTAQPTLCGSLELPKASTAQLNGRKPWKTLTYSSIVHNTPTQASFHPCKRLVPLIATDWKKAVYYHSSRKTLK